MRFNRLYSLLSLFLVLFISCSSDDNDDTGGSSKNINKNIIQHNPHVTRLEFPRVKDDDMNLVLTSGTSDYGVTLSVEWDCNKKAQRWTCFSMYAKNAVKNWNRKQWEDTEWHGDPFQEDKRIPERFRSTLSQYRGSGYNRGHICASEDRVYSQDANEQTFYMSNIHPQTYKFNTGIWLEMESKLRDWNRSGFRDTLYVCKGGTIDREDQIIEHTSRGLIVPKYFFMAVLCKNKMKGNDGYKALAFWVKHDGSIDKRTPLKNFVISIDELEKKTGIDFFCNLPDNIEKKVEEKTITSLWGL